MKNRPTIDLVKTSRKSIEKFNFLRETQVGEGFDGWNEEIYLEMYPDVENLIELGSISSGIEHFLSNSPPYNPTEIPKFPQDWDELGYLTLYPDVARMVKLGAIANGFHHYSSIGNRNKLELPIPSDWSEDFYLTLYPPIAEAVESRYFTSGYEHYLLYGRSEGRRKLENQPTDWDEEGYLNINLDVLEAVKNKQLPSGWYHFELYGRGERRVPGLPLGFTDALMKISQFEPALYPSADFVRLLTRYEAVRPSVAGDIYYDFFVATNGTTYTHVLLAPWIKTGGSDKVTLMHLEYLASHAEAKVLLLLTEDTDSPWLGRVPQNVTVFQIDNRFESLDRLEQKNLFFRFLSTSRARNIHIINSAIGWRLLCENGVALQSQFKIFVSLFAFGYSSERELVGYARMVPEVWTYVDYFITDNEFIISQVRSLYGIPEQKFYAIKYPVNCNIRFEWSGKTKRLLWASRFDNEKRPDILYEIARQIPNIQIDAFGDITIDKSSNLEELICKFKDLDNVNLRGRFNGFDSIPVSDYAFFLYTSQSDGLPNVLLEAQSSGLPTLAPDVGGISEIVPRRSGFLVSDFSNVNEYVDCIYKILGDIDLLINERRNFIENIQTNRSFKKFYLSLRNIPNYC